MDVDSAGLVGRVGFARGPRDDAGRHARRPGYASGTALTTYAELYGLSRARDGRARCRVRFTFQPRRGFMARAAAGRYRVTLAVTDVPSNVKSETVALEITVR